MKTAHCQDTRQEPFAKMLHQPPCEECTNKIQYVPFSTSDLPKFKGRNDNKWNFCRSIFVHCAVPVQTRHVVDLIYLDTERNSLREAGLQSRQKGPAWAFLQC